MAIAEATPPQNARELWVIDATTRAARRIAIPPPRQDPEGDVYQRVVSASFAPDGRHLLVLSDVDSMCVHPRTPTPCVCDAALYQVGIDGSGWRRLSATFQGCGDVLWMR
jgi:precorrin isomerase